jgi:uncharacterized protein YbjT (DUF2867 family)
MKVIVFGATGMVGAGVLLECLDDARVDAVLTVGRTPVGMSHPKLREIVHADFFDFVPIQAQLAGYDACFYCLGTTSLRQTEESYRRVTYDMTLSAANAVIAANPALTFVFVSGLGTDSSERGRAMWARIKGKAENALFRMPFKATYAFRPGFIQPLRGVRSKTPAYQVIYSVLAPFVPLARRLFPRYVTTTVEIGRAMINVVERGYPTPIVEMTDIHRLASMATVMQQIIAR